MKIFNKKMRPATRNIATLLLTFFSISGARGQQPIPDVEYHKLSNGIEVMFVEYGALPVTSVNFYFNTGKVNETPGLQMLSSLTASCLKLGNDKMDRIEQDDRLFCNWSISKYLFIHPLFRVEF